jgi:hypothetical protein
MPTLKSLNLYDLIDQSRAEENMFDVEFIVLNPDWRAQGSMKGRGFKLHFPCRFFAFYYKSIPFSKSITNFVKFILFLGNICSCRKGAEFFRKSVKNCFILTKCRNNKRKYRNEIFTVASGCRNYYGNLHL